MPVSFTVLWLPVDFCSASLHVLNYLNCLHHTTPAWSREPGALGYRFTDCSGPQNGIYIPYLFIYTHSLTKNVKHPDGAVEMKWKSTLSGQVMITGMTESALPLITSPTQYRRWFHVELSRTAVVSSASQPIASGTAHHPAALNLSWSHMFNWEKIRGAGWPTWCRLEGETFLVERWYQGVVSARQRAKPSRSIYQGTERRRRNDLL